ncbi:hypothetical protein BHM03_00024575, partial [Ensete ventricosum]
DFMHIVLVHYLEVKVVTHFFSFDLKISVALLPTPRTCKVTQGQKPSFSRSREVEDVPQDNQVDSPVCSNSITNHSQLPSQATDVESPISLHTSEYEDAESGCFQGIHDDSDFYSVTREDRGRVFNETGLGLTFIGSKTQLDLASWDEVLEHCATSRQMPSFQSSAGITEAMTEEISSKQTSVHADLYAENPGTRQDVSIILDKFEWQVLLLFLLTSFSRLF